MQTIRQTGWMVARQLRNISRQPIWVVMMVIQPMIWLVLYGQLYKHVGAQGRGPSAGSYIQFLAPGIICMNAFFGGMWSGMGMITDLDRKVVDRFLAAPASRFAIVLSQVVRAGITAMVQTLILLLVGLALGVRVHGGALGWLVIFAAAFLLAAAFAGFSNGLALIFRRPESMIATANMVGLPLMFLSSILVTFALMPGWIKTVARFNPVNWGVHAARHASGSSNAAGVAGEYLLLLLAATAVTSLFATWCFRSYQRSI
jgi:ABC-2 type transport system permease protein